jgi:hypothetical protein
MAQVVACLPSKYKTLSSDPSPATKIKKDKEEIQKADKLTTNYVR